MDQAVLADLTDFLEAFDLVETLYASEYTAPAQDTVAMLTLASANTEQSGAAPTPSNSDSFIFVDLAALNTAAASDAMPAVVPSLPELTTLAADEALAIIVMDGDVGYTGLEPAADPAIQLATHHADLFAA